MKKLTDFDETATPKTPVSRLTYYVCTNCVLNPEDT
ncbi:unnamed protein product, partial [marine sediment metagenome]